VPRRQRPPYVRWKIHVDAVLAAEVESMYYDPVHQKPRYGERSVLISELLRQWVKQQKERDAVLTSLQHGMKGPES
jgi:hypothetical protein